jgi:sortase A
LTSVDTSIGWGVDIMFRRDDEATSVAKPAREIPKSCRMFVESLIEDARARSSLDHRTSGRYVDWDSIWHAGDGASSTEQALGRIIMAARETADQIALRAEVRNVAPEPVFTVGPDFPLSEAVAAVAELGSPQTAASRTPLVTTDQPTQVHLLPKGPAQGPRMRVIAPASGWSTAFTWIRNIGIVLLLFVVWQLWGTSISQHHAQSQLQKVFAATVNKHAPEAKSTSDPVLVSAHQVVPVPVEGSPVAKLQIPRIGLDEIVVSGTADSDLAKGPGHYIGSAAPGQAGNVAIAGHRTTNGAPFNQLGQLAIGDQIFLTTTSGERLTYDVSQTPQPVSPNDVAVLDDFGDNRITLTTCNPEYSATQRLIVVGELQQPKPMVATRATPHAYHITNAQTASLDWSLLPVVVIELGVLLLLGLSNRRFAAWYGGAARWFILVPLWGVGLYVLFGTLTMFLPSSI